MAADPSYNALIHKNQGGTVLTAESGATVDLLSGSTVDIAGTFKVGGTAVTATAAQLNYFASQDVPVYVKKVALAAVDTGGGLFAFLPGVAFIVHRLIVNITTKSTGAGTMDAGVAANVTTLSDTLIDGYNIAATEARVDNLISGGTNGKASQRGSATDAITGSVASGNSAGIVGYAYIFWSPI